jgi:NAD(P)-dependent dehydrogenase (short-subunit alcohol dehydrogenase family)
MSTSSPLVRTAFLTGANRGLGLEWTRQLAGRVDRLFATCRHPEEAHDLADQADAHPDTVEVFALDVADPDAIDRAAEQVKQETGALDLLVNNAGINGGGTSDRFGTVDPETMMDVLRVNTAGPHLMTQAFADLLRAGGTNDSAGADESVVVNVTSQLGSIANTSGGGWHSYKASKAALNMCTRLQAGALSGDAIVVSMHPGWVRTDMGGSNARLSTEESVAGMLDVLAGLTPDDTGRFLAYDGGELPW